MPDVELRGRKVYYEVHGEGETLVLLHHGFGCTAMWKGIHPYLVERGYRVIVYDRRGYGRSEGGAEFARFYVSAQVRPESVTELGDLMAFLEVEKFHLIGQCEGGVIAFDAALRFPDRVRTVITSSTQCYSEVPMTRFNEIKFPDSFDELAPALREKLIRWHGETRARPFYNQFRRYGGAYGKDVFDLRGLLPRITCPALVLYPDRSFLFDVAQGVTMYRCLPKGELAVLPACGHNTYEHRPREYARQVTDFLARHGF
ncbi:MAG: hypothetical protein DRH56_06875 [Deltaproteobacteria bacterium]|nr:MAG: hypothetical protein DRH56_06875 [Deltaproteobacteria bacterium]